LELDVAPSPKKTSDTLLSPFIFAAQEKPTACVICVPMGELTEPNLYGLPL
jgi:hypothetical protein